MEAGMQSGGGKPKKGPSQRENRMGSERLGTKKSGPGPGPGPGLELGG